MKSFRIRNIKSFLDSGTIELAPITIFVGKNSCGKSSLLRFPVVLAQSVVSSTSNPVLFNGKYVDYGFFENVVHNQNGDTISYEFSYNVDVNCKDDLRYYIEDDDDEIYEKNIKTVKMLIEVTSYDKKTVIKSISMFIADKRVVTFGVDGKRKYVKLFYIINNERFKKVNYDFDLKSLTFEMGGFPLYEPGDLFAAVYGVVMGENVENDNIRPVSDLYDRLFLSGNPYSRDNKLGQKEKELYSIKMSFDRISNIMSHVYVYFKDDAYMMSYIGPFREAPSRIYRDSESSSATMGVGVWGENVSNLLVRDYRRNSKLIEEISKWIAPTLGYKLSIEDMNNGFFQIELVDKRGLHSDISDVGYGISQVLPIVTQVIKNSTNEISSRGRIVTSKPIFIEQPELHLHPAAQAKLADLFAKCIGKEGTNSNIVIETHSEHLIRRLQVLISDEKCPLTSDMVKIYYVDKNKQGNATVTNMKLSESGKFETEWPSGFFDQAYSLTMDLLKNNAEEL